MRYSSLKFPQMLYLNESVEGRGAQPRGGEEALPGVLGAAAGRGEGGARPHLCMTSVLSPGRLHDGTCEQGHDKIVQRDICRWSLS